MTTEYLQNPTNIIGDDLPYNSQWLRKVPDGFGFDALTYPEDRPLTYALKDKFNVFAKDYYRNYEIVGMTYADFQTNLQCDLLLNIDTMEKMLEVYQDDIAKPLQSRTIKRTYDITDDGTASQSGTSSGSNTSNIENTDYDIPIDNGTAQGTSKNISSGTGSSSGQSSSSGTTKNTKTGSEIEEWSDVGVAPNYTLLNGFLDNNRSYFRVFVSFFKDDFTLNEVMYIG